MRGLLTVAVNNNSVVINKVGPSNIGFRIGSTAVFPLKTISLECGSNYLVLDHWLQNALLLTFLYETSVRDLALRHFPRQALVLTDDRNILCFLIIINVQAEEF